MNIPTLVESARGCGYRKPGGLYLVSGQLSEPCPLLPVETSTCPTCGEGIKPARGFTWVDGEKFLSPKPHGTMQHERVCPLAPLLYIDRGPSEVPEGKRPSDYVPGDGGEFQSRLGRCGLIWVGEQHYKTPQAFMREAAQMGVSRRIAAVPRDFKVGETWVLLGHRKAIEKACSECGDLPETHPGPGTLGTVREVRPDGSAVVALAGVSGPDPECPVCNGTGYEHRPGIITAFQPTAVEYVVTGEETEEELEAMVERGLSPVRVVKAEQEALL